MHWRAATQPNINCCHFTIWKTTPIIKSLIIFRTHDIEWNHEQPIVLFYSNMLTNHFLIWLWLPYPVLSWPMSSFARIYRISFMKKYIYTWKLIVWKWQHLMTEFLWKLWSRWKSQSDCNLFQKNWKQYMRRGNWGLLSHGDQWAMSHTMFREIYMSSLHDVIKDKRSATYRYFFNIPFRVKKYIKNGK